MPAPELPPIHDGHHQIQQDHARARAGAEVAERGLAVVGIDPTKKKSATSQVWTNGRGISNVAWWR